MTKAEIRMLERIYAAEIAGRLPFQSKSKLLPKLAEDGLVRRLEKHMPGRFAVTIHGWELTLAGNLTYCLSCDDAHDDIHHEGN